MTGQQTIGERVRLRRSLLQLASLLMLTLISIMLLSLFSVWSLDRAYARAIEENRRFVATLDSSRQVQIAFKLQVQEWKNLLLRGADSTDKAKYEGAYLADAQSVAAGLETLSTQIDALNLAALSGTARELAQQHRGLLERYQQAVSDHESGPWDGVAIDRTVRGIDRPLNDRIDRLAQQIREAFQARADRVEAELRQRYTTLRQLQWAATILAAGLIGLLLWRVLRDRSGSD